MAAALRSAPARHRAMATVVSARALRHCRPTREHLLGHAAPHWQPAPAVAQRNSWHSQIGVRRHLAPVAAITSSAAAGDSSSGSLLASAQGFLRANFIPVGLLTAITLGWLFPGPGVAAAGLNLQMAATICIFLISGLLLQRGEAAAALRSLPALAYGLPAILLLTPLLGRAVLALPLQPREGVLGLAVFCCMPTTLSTGVTLTTAAGGNTAVALLLTVASNMLGVFSIPPMLDVVLGGGGTAGAALDAPRLFRSLLVTVLAPLLAGAAAQGFVPGVRDWRQRNRPLLAYASALCLCTVPWMQVSKASAAGLPVTPAGLAGVLAAGLGLHLVLLALNTAATGLLRFAPDPAQNAAIRKAVVLCTSQKTLPVAVAVLAQMGPSLGAGVGFAVIPCVAAHLIQTVVDSALVARWNRADAQRAATAAA